MQSHDNFSYEVFNIGVGVEGTSVLEMVSRFEEINKLKINKRISDRRAGDIIVSWADVTKSKLMLGWEATRSLEVIVKQPGISLLRWKDSVDASDISASSHINFVCHLKKLLHNSLMHDGP